MNIQTSRGLPRRPRRPLPVALAPNRVKAIATARRHSRRVRLLRLLLPLCAAAVLGLYFVSSKLSLSLGDMEASVGDVKISRDSLRMINPKLEGATKDAGTYKLTADYADQDITNMQTLRLHAVSAQLTQPKDAWSKLTAPKGTFDTKKESLELYGGIQIATSSGMTAKLDRAAIDLKTHIIRSEVPVEVEAKEGKLTARTLEIKAAEKRILFAGDVRVHVVRGRKPDQAKTADGGAAPPAEARD